MKRIHMAKATAQIVRLTVVFFLLAIMFGCATTVEDVARWEAQGDSQAVDALIAALEDEDYNVRSNAEEALGKIGEPKAVDALIAALGDEDYNVRSNAEEALIKIGEPAVDALIEALEDENSVVRKYAAEALGKIGGAKTIDSLSEALRDKNVSSIAAYALTKIGTVDALARVMPFSYLPLAKGNRWRYKITLAEDGKYTVRRWCPEINSVTIQKFQWEDAKEGTHILEFIVETENLVKRKRDLLGAWKVSVKGEIGKKIYGPPRLGGPVYWNLTQNGVKFESINSGLTYYEMTHIIPGGIERSAKSYRILLADPVYALGLQGVAKDGRVKDMMDLGIRYYEKDRSACVSVPAGDFPNCLLIITEEPEAEDSNKLTLSTDSREHIKVTAPVPHSLARKIYSYYAQGIGLVKEYQEDARGQRLLTMELLDYELNFPKVGSAP